VRVAPDVRRCRWRSGRRSCHRRNSTTPTPSRSSPPRNEQSKSLIFLISSATRRDVTWRDVTRRDVKSHVFASLGYKKKSQVPLIWRWHLVHCIVRTMGLPAWSEGNPPASSALAVDEEFDLRSKGLGLNA
jgi:hypothetical protein